MNRMSLIVVKAAFDEDAGVWFVESSDLPGLNAEAPSVEELLRKVEVAAADLLEEGDASFDLDVPIELVAHASARARVRSAA